ncbi:MAG: tyrosine-type recombinase/integrase [Myxococcales bacterium]|nr:tyrosine-type recombinase/integrase [Myxococcales bacterium]
MTIRVTERARSGRSPVWRVSIHLKLAGGRVERKEFNRPREQSHRAVTRWARQKHAELLRERALADAAGVGEIDDVTFAEYARRFLTTYAHRKGLKPSSRRAYEDALRTHLLPNFGRMRVDAIADRHLDQLRDLELSAGTRNRLIAQMSTILNAAFRERCRRAAFRATSVKQDQREPEFWSVADFDALLAAAPSDEHSLVLMLGGLAGLRLGEIAALRRADVNFTRGRRGALHVRRSIWQGQVSTPKGRRSRAVPLHTRLRAVLERWCAGLEEEDLLLATADGRPLTQSMIKHRVRVCEAAMQGVPTRAARGATHKLRHTFCSHLAIMGVSVVQIQRLAGHASLRDTMRYMHLSPSDLDDAIDVLSRRRAGG